MQPTIDQILSLSVAVFVLIDIGLKSTMAFYTTIAISNWICRIIGADSLDVNCPQVFDQLYKLMVGPLGPKIGALDRSPKTTRILLHLSIGAIVLAVVIPLQVAGLFVMSGIVVASTHFSWISIDMLGAYQTIIAALVMFTISFMTYTNQRVQESSTYV